MIATFTALLGGVASANTRVDFAFDSAQLPPEIDPELMSLVSSANNNPGQRIVLDGHADPTGDAAYNVNLSLRRALAVRDRLVALGVDSDRIVIAAFGEDNLALRRVTARLTTDSITSIVDSSFAGHGTSVTWDKPLSVAQLDEPSTTSVARQ